MKKEYLAPKTLAFLFTPREGIMTVSNIGRSSTNLNIVDSTEEDDWEY